MNEQEEVTVIFNDDSSGSLPVYALYVDQYQPQDAYITLDLRDGGIDADYNSETSCAIPFSVCNDVVIRFPIDPRLTGESILAVIDMYKIQLQDFYKNSDTEINFQGNEVGIPVGENADRSDWKEKIRVLQENIEMYSHSLAVYVADNDTFNQSIELTPNTSDLHAYATSVLEGVKGECFVDSAMDDVDIISHLIIDLYIFNKEALNKNGMEMLLANIDDYSDQIGYDRDDIEQVHIDAAMKRT